MDRRAADYFVAAILLLALGGCVREDSEGPTRTFAYELWVPFSVLLLGVVAGPAGWFVREKSKRFGWILLILSPVAAVVFAPSLYRDRAVVDDAGFSLRTGFWGLTAVHAIEFADLQRVRIISEAARGRRGFGRKNYFLLCERTDGSAAKIPVNNDVSEAAAPHFLKRVSDLGIPIEDKT